MNKYIALIRGINVGGNNKVSMRELSMHLELAGLANVTTYINSGNVIFDSDQSELENLVLLIEGILKTHFKVITRVAVISSLELHKSIKGAPSWWGKDPESKHNALFIIAPANAEVIAKQVGDAKDEYEQVQVDEHIIFWSAPLKTFSRTRWSKIVGTDAYDWVTIRNLNTINKLVELTK